jgi:hypothetical protein
MCPSSFNKSKSVNKNAVSFKRLNMLPIFKFVDGYILNLE